MVISCFGAERAAFHYSDLSRENISSAMEEWISFVETERAQNSLFTDVVNERTLHKPFFFYH